MHSQLPKLQLPTSIAVTQKRGLRPAPCDSEIGSWELKYFLPFKRPHDREHLWTLRRLGRELEELLEVHGHTIDAIGAIVHHTGVVMCVSIRGLPVAGRFELGGCLRPLLLACEREAQLKMPGRQIRGYCRGLAR